MLVDKKPPVDAVLPILFSWLFIPRIEQLRKFLLQFKDLDATQMLTVIWQMVHPASLTSSYEDKICAVHQLIGESPQLSVLQTIMREKEVVELEHKTRYLEIKQEIWSVFARDMTRTDSMREELFRLIQTSSPEIVIELSYHYHSIWVNPKLIFLYNLHHSFNFF